MGNILDYLDWRGDLTFEQTPFNQVDNLILACFSYLDLDEIADVKNNRKNKKPCNGKIQYCMALQN